MPLSRVKKHQHNYVIMDKSGLTDKRLSLRARGMLAYFLTKPDDWEINIRDLARQTPEGREALTTAMRELEQYGYAVKTLYRDDQGRLRGYVTTIYETADLARADIQKTEVGFYEVGAREVGTREVGQPAPTKELNTTKDLKKRGLKEEEENSLVDQPGKPGKSTTERSPSLSLSRLKKKKAYSALFWAFYEAYPRHEDPDDAWKAWQSLDGDAMAPTIMAGVDANKRANDAWKRGDRQYIKLPAAFLRKGGYKSDFVALPHAGEHDPEHFRQLLDAEGISYEC